MKKLVFIDNDFEEYAREDTDRLKRMLYLAGMDLQHLNAMETISEFYKLERVEKYKIISNPNNVICTWSMYTQTHFNSLGQLVSLFEATHRHGDKGLVYLDGSGLFKESISEYIKHTKTNLYEFLCGITKNTILSFDSDWQLVKLMLDFTNDELFREEEVSRGILDYTFFGQS